MKTHAEDHSHGELRRDVTIWGSYMWGYADVGADIYVALGLVMASAKGATLYAFAFAGLVYIMIGLAYTELASAYPVAGGGPYYALRGLGDFWGFVGGSALALDYTIDIGLFAVSSSGYFNYFLPNWLVNASIKLGPIENFQWFWCLETLVLIFFLVWINVRGMRESSLLNEIIGAVDILLESFIIILGFSTAWDPHLIVNQLQSALPTFRQFMYGSSLAIISYVGLESISQAAQETRRPSTIVPRTSLTLIFTVFLFAISLSTLSLGMLPWQVVAQHQDNPVAVLASHLPILGHIAGALAAVMGFFILLISSNSGVMSVSRVVYSLSQFDLITKWLNEVHPKFKTPVRAILVFSGIGILEAVLSFFSKNALDTLGNMYAFGATLGYLLVFISLVKLRFSDPYTPRPYKMPFNLKINLNGEKVDFPVLGILGVLGVSLVLFEVILTHKIGRIAGPAWVVLCFFYYAWYRNKKGLPIFGNIERDWEQEQKQVLESAEEYDLLEQYKWALVERDKRKKMASSTKL
jgi:APA family basic amino acid/polyamine antiporter